MRTHTKLLSLILFTAAFAITAAAQDSAKPEQDRPAASQPVHFYRLELVLQEVDAAGKVTNSRTYHLTVSTERGSHDSMRAESKIPITTSSTVSDGKENAIFQYQDVGVRIDVRDTREAERSLAFVCSASVSSVANQAGATTPPIIRNNYWEGPVSIPIGKPTVIFASDSTDGKGSMQVTATATLIQ